MRRSEKIRAWALLIAAFGLLVIVATHKPFKHLVMNKSDKAVLDANGNVVGDK